MNPAVLNSPTGTRLAGLHTALSSSLTTLEGVSLKVPPGQPPSQRMTQITDSDSICLQPCRRPQSVKYFTSNPRMASEAGLGETAEDHCQQAPTGRLSGFFRHRLAPPVGALGLAGTAPQARHAAAIRPGSLTARSSPGEDSEKTRVRGEPSGAVTERAQRSSGLWGPAGAWARHAPRPEPQHGQAHPREEGTRPAAVGEGGRLAPALAAPSCGTEPEAKGGGSQGHSAALRSAAAASDQARGDGSDSLLERGAPCRPTLGIRFGRPDALSVNLPILASPALLRRSLPSRSGALAAAAGGTCGTSVRGLRSVAGGDEPAETAVRGRGDSEKEEEWSCGRLGGRRQCKSDAAGFLGSLWQAVPRLPGRMTEPERRGAVRQARSAVGLGVAGLRLGGRLLHAHYPVPWDVATKVGRCSLPGVQLP